MDNKNNKNNPRNNRQGWGVILFTTLLTLFIVMGLYSLMQDRDPEEISYDKFLKLVDEGKVEKVTLETSRIYITLKEGVEKEEKERKTEKRKKKGRIPRTRWKTSSRICGTIC